RQASHAVILAQRGEPVRVDDDGGEASRWGPLRCSGSSSRTPCPANPPGGGTSISRNISYRNGIPHSTDKNDTVHRGTGNRRRCRSHLPKVARTPGHSCPSPPPCRKRRGHRSPENNLD